MLLSKHIKYSLVKYSLALLAGLLLNGCATQGGIAPQAAPDTAPIRAVPSVTVSSGDETMTIKPEGWWQIGFRIYWEQVADLYDEAEDEVSDEALVDVCIDPALDEADGDDANIATTDDDAVDEEASKTEEEDVTTKAEAPKKEKDFISPNWYLGSLIADQIVAPVIKQQGDGIFLWRFHRRAGADATGHQFSFIFYSDQAKADEVVAQIQASPVLAQLHEAQLLHDVVYPNTDTINKPLISDTADARWPEEIKSTWPLFIMGASQMWLMQLETIADAHEDAQPEMTLDEMLELYEDVQATMDEMWQEKARHAYFHHMNGLYAYEKVLVGF